MSLLSTINSYTHLNFNTRLFYQNIKRTAIEICLMSSYTASSFLPIPRIGSVLTQMGFCARDYMPVRIEEEIENFVNFNATIKYKMFNSGNLRLGVGAPVVEEAIFRLGIQEILLKQIPKKILPKYAHLIEHNTAAKISRVLISSALFGIAHYMNDIEYGCELSNGIFTPFLLGIFLGTLQEQISNPLYSTIAHIFHNTLWGVIVSGAGKYA